MGRSIRIGARCMHFPVAGIDLSPLVPVGVALCLTTLMSMGGLSGAFVLLPFQVSVLGFTGPAVTPTNHLFNAVAIPSAVYRYVREKRMVWPLVWTLVAGTIPGVVGGTWVRIVLLPDARHFKLFMGLVLLFIGSRLVQTLRPSVRAAPGPAPGAEATTEPGTERGEPGKSTTLARAEPGPAEPAARFCCRTLRFDWNRIEYEFDSQRHGISTLGLGAVSAVVGVVGGAYGVGGGAIIAPVLVSMFGLPVHSIAGATLLGTWLTSLVAVAVFVVVEPLLGLPATMPDVALGLLFGLGGLGGMYLGARLQKRVSARAIEAVLAVVVSALALSYVVGFFAG
jgi:uncharacterized membrane protein YfcA